MASLVVTSFSTQFWHFVLGQGLLFGLGVGLMSAPPHPAAEHQLILYSTYRFYPSLAACSTHFVKYRATALGMAAAGSGIGMYIFLIMNPPS
jgi:hypothetical protein